MLNIQYRMHPAISQFPSLEFYNLSLLDGTIDRSGYVSPKLMPPNISAALLPPGHTGTVEEGGDIRPQVSSSNRPPVIFLDHAGTESPKSKSRVNWNEAHIVASVVEDLLLHNDVSILSVQEWYVTNRLSPRVYSDRTSELLHPTWLRSRYLHDYSTQIPSTTSVFVRS